MVPMEGKDSTQQEVEVLARNLEDVGFKYVWKIEDYLKGVDEDIVVDSDVFGIFVNGLKTYWSMGIRYWKDESGLRLTNPVVICLNLVSANAERNGIEMLEQIQVRYQFGIWNNLVKQFEVCPVGSKSLQVGDPRQLFQSVDTREIMILDRHLVGKSIKIFVKLMLIREEIEQNTLALDLWAKLKNGEDCDVYVKASDGSLIPAHKTILCCRSAVLKSMINDEDNTIKLDITTSLLASLLQYIYTDRVDPLDNPQNLLKFAVKLQLPGLKNICEKALLDSITPMTVASLLLVADTFGCELLKKSAMAFIEENSHAIVKTVAWKVMEEINPQLFEEVCQNL